MANTSTNPIADLHEIPQILKPRTVVKKVLAKEQAEGVGVTVRRSIGRPELKNFNPFLLLDYGTFSPPTGFPDHPHRGFETVTYVLEGQLAHENFAGHKGIIGPEDLQWMTAGRGILHSEMSFDNSVNKGLQLWINLTSKEKMIESNYQELQSEDINRVQKDGVDVRIIAWEALGVQSPLYTLNASHIAPPFAPRRRQEPPGPRGAPTRLVEVLHRGLPGARYLKRNYPGDPPEGDESIGLTSYPADYSRPEAEGKTSP